MSNMFDILSLTFLLFLQVLILSHLCCYMDSVKKMDLMEDLMPIIAHLHDVSVKLPDVFPQVLHLVVINEFAILF